MRGLESWLPEKEMFGVFQLHSLKAVGDSLELAVHNEVFCFTLSFADCVQNYRVTPAEENERRLSELRESYEVIMRGNTFFRLYDGAEDTIRHYVAVCTNYVVDIWSSAPAKVRLEKSTF